MGSLVYVSKPYSNYDLHWRGVVVRIAGPPPGVSITDVTVGPLDISEGARICSAVPEVACRARVLKDIHHIRILAGGISYKQKKKG